MAGQQRIVQAEDLTGDGNGGAKKHRGGQMTGMRNARGPRQDVEIRRKNVSGVHGEERNQRVKAKPGVDAESPLCGNLSLDNAAHNTDMANHGATQLKRISLI